MPPNSYATIECHNSSYALNLATTTNLNYDHALMLLDLPNEHIIKLARIKHKLPIKSTQSEIVCFSVGNQSY